MAKDGTHRGGRCTRAGTKPKPLIDKIAEGKPAMQLSGGEQRRVAIARLLFRKVKVVFADEPTASLDQNNRDRIQELLLGLAQNNKLVIIATHDLELANACTEVVEL